jgi:hypothetical protein
MKRSFLIFFIPLFIILMFLSGCKGSISQPIISYSVSMGDSYLKESIHMIDRKIMSIDLDTQGVEMKDVAQRFERIFLSRGFAIIWTIAWLVFFVSYITYSEITFKSYIY